VVLTQCEIGSAIAAEALQLGRSIGATTICNASPALDLGIFNAADIDVLIVNRTEAELMARESQPDRAARMLSARTGGTVVLTLGADGLIVASAGDVTAVPAVPAPTVRDTTGAGDVFAGALACGIALGQTVTDALDLARRAASWTVGRLGTLGPQLADL
jgi:ribokinase